ncbi:MAG TPA: tetratricopeptide repeat protein [Niabella sp.]|nr:tetratricopeptide repeat protein [Niabella sp.]
MSCYKKIGKATVTAVIVALLFSGSSSLFAQAVKKYPVLLMPDSKEKVDSILKTAESLRQDPHRQILYTEAFRLVKELDYKKAEAAVYDAYGVYKRDMSQYDEAINYHNIGLDLALRRGDVKMQIRSYNNLGVVHRRIDDYNTAIEYLHKALTLSEKIGDDYNITIALNSIGNIYLSIEDYEAAIHYFKKCIPIAIKAGNSRGIAINLQNIGDCFERMMKTDSAEKYYQNALVYNIGRDDEKGIAICYNSLGNIFKKQGQVDKGLSLLKKALHINIKLGDQLFVAVSYSNIGDAYFLKKDYQLAKKFFDTSLQIAKNIGSIAEVKNAYEGLTKIAVAEEDWKNAYVYNSIFKRLSDSIFLKSNITLRNQEKKYNEDKIALLQTNDRNKNIIVAGSLVLFLLLLVSGILYYLRYRLLERNRSLQRELEIRSQIASDLHDDMGSSLSSIHIFSELLRKNGHDSHDLLSKIEANAKDTLEALDDIIWLVKPSNDKFSNLSMHISEFSIPLFESKNINFEIDFPECIAEVPLPMETRRNIFLIIKESVNNLVKYAECTEASIRATYNEGYLRFVIKDNGKGFDPSKPTNRNGVKNLKARAKQINADLQIYSVPGWGTQITLIVRDKELTMLHAV